jgi:hypothetical protein
MITAKTDNARNLPAWLSRRALPTIVPQGVEIWPIDSLLVGHEPSLTNYGEFFLNMRFQHFTKVRAVFLLGSSAPLKLAALFAHLTKTIFEVVDALLERFSRWTGAGCRRRHPSDTL